MRSILYSLNWLCLKCLHASVYGSNSVKFTYIERENICIHVYLNLFFKFGLCCFIFPHLLNFPQNYFSQNLFCFSYFYRGEKLFLQPMLFIGGVVALHWGSCLYFLYFSWPLLCMFTIYLLWLSCLCQYVTNRGRNRWNL